ncbi:MAG: hypothetical protein IIC91_07025 [Chloroflexi bacterium]|nr:hypothetical protein [Chloroflexota bacterium]
MRTSAVDNLRQYRHTTSDWWPPIGGPERCSGVVPPTPGDTWGGSYNMTAPDGIIDLPNDILGVILQFNHSCQ